jgi:hypothetical protein
MDVVAKAMGLDNGTQLAIVILIAKFSGFLEIVRSVFSVLSTVLFTINGSISLLNSLGSALAWVFGAITKIGPALTKLGGFATSAFGVIQTAVVAVATALGLPVAAVVAIGAAIAALVVLAYVYWYEIKAAAGAAWDWIVDKWDGLTEWIGGVFDAAAAKISEFWEGMKDSASSTWDAVVALWDGFTDWIGDVFDAAMTKLGEFWDWLAAAPGRAWDGLVSVWAGFEDFFSNMIGKVTGYFKGLWDGVKNGASDAWNSVKGWFGMGEDEPLPGTADKSPRLRTGGIIRGAGTGTSDSIRAWLSNGEGVINARAVRHYGEGFIHALNQLMLPQTHFATGGIVGDLVPAGAGRASGLSDLHLNLLGQRTNGGIYADADGMRGIKRDLRKVARASRGPAPRWRGY